MAIQENYRSGFREPLNFNILEELQLGDDEVVWTEMPDQNADAGTRFEFRFGNYVYGADIYYINIEGMSDQTENDTGLLVYNVPAGQVDDIIFVIVAQNSETLKSNTENLRVTIN